MIMKKRAIQRRTWLLLMTLVGLFNNIMGQSPDWSVNASDYQFSMTIVASIKLNNVSSDDPNDRIGVFVNDELRGTAFLNIHVGSTDTEVAFIQVYSNQASGESLTFKIYDANGDQLINAVTTEIFEDGKKLGENLKPFEVTDNTLVTDISLDITSINENVSSGSLTATLSNNDLDIGQTHTYSLVGGDGDIHNSDFSISGEQLTLNATYDYENLTTVSLRIKVVDSKNGPYEEALTLPINDQNDQPTDLNLSNSAIDENSQTGHVIGAFSSSDQDSGETFTYNLISGTGDDDNAMFSIDGSGDLLVNGALDFETTPSLSIRVKTTDSGGLSFEKSFSINVADINDAPSNLSLNTSSIDENAGSNVLFATLSSTDEDSGDSHTYSLVSGSGSTDNGSFLIRNGNELFAAASFDFENEADFSIRLRTQDQSGGTFDKSFQLSVNDVNDSPTDLSLSANIIAENGNSGDLIGQLSATDQDVSDNHSFTLIAGDGDGSNALFSIDGQGRLLASSSFDYENLGSHPIRIKATDSNGAEVEKVFSILITDANDIPTDIALSSSSLVENSGLLAQIGSFSASDEDVGDTHSFSLVEGQGDDENAAFSIDSQGNLLSSEDFDFEAKSTYSIRVRANDGSGGSYEEMMEISITNQNEAPSEILLAETQIDENSFDVSKVTSLSATDVDLADTHSFELVSGDGDDDNGAFLIKNDSELHAKAAFDFETQNEYRVRLKATDVGGLTFEGVFIITVNDINDAPTTIALLGTKVDENSGQDVLIGSFSTQDQDENDVHTFSLIEGDGGDSNNLFAINDNGDLITKSSFNFESSASHGIRVIVQDSDGASFKKVFTISINDLNDAPQSVTLSNNNVLENLAAGSLIGQLQIEDEDTSDSHLLELVAGSGDSGNDLFEISDGSLLSKWKFDFEQQNEYSLRVKVTDGGGAAIETVLNVVISDDNDEPTAIALSNNALDENLGADAKIGLFSVTDEDQGQVYTFELASGDGDTDNALFEINGTELIAKGSFNHEASASRSVRVKATETNGDEIEESFTVLIEDVNDDPSNLVLTSSSVTENSPGGTHIGDFEATDEDVNETYAYILSAKHSDNNFFGITAGNQLVVAGELNFEEQNAFIVKIQAIDSEGNRFEREFGITVLNVAEAGINVSENLVDFGSTALGQPKEQTLVVNNTGPDGVLEITNFELPPGFSIDKSSASINPGESLEFVLRFAPLTPGRVEDVMMVTSNAGQIEIQLTGEGNLVTGIDDLPDLSHKMKLFPNPSEGGMINLEMEAFGSEPYTINIMSMSGRTMLHKPNAKGNKFSFDTRFYRKGIYLILVSNSDRIAKKRLIIK